jgi:nucleoside 2-deoxyribosyltransferase
VKHCGCAICYALSIDKKSILAIGAFMRHLVLLFIAISSIFTAYSAYADKPVYSIYLAGPEVFLPEPVKAGKTKQQRIAALNESEKWPFTLVGLYPLDNEIADFKPDQDTGIRIYYKNIELMDKADFIAANMVRFRGPSMDVGTAFEIGYIRGLKKPVFAYYETEPFYGSEEVAGLYAEKVAKFYTLNAKDPHKDVHGQSIENFNMADNLMMMGALQSGNGEIAADFDSVIKQIAAYIQQSTKQQ